MAERTEREAPEPEVVRPRRLDGRVAIVTGGDSGIGRAIVEASAIDGADVALTFHSDEDGGRAAAAAAEGHGVRAMSRQLDARDDEAVERLFDEVEATLGTPHILVNNAGIGQSGTPVAEMTAEAFDAILRTDLYGPFFTCRAFVRRRRDKGPGGKIVNVTSVHEAIPSPEASAYGAAKGGLLAFTRSLSLELAPMRINVNAVAPGLIRTPMTQERTDDPETRAEELPNIPWHRPGQPWEVARLVAYLASFESDYVTGQSFTIDGGLQMDWGQGA